LAKKAATGGELVAAFVLALGWTAPKEKGHAAMLAAAG
jgi:hypothetical protein